jgi:glycosyltransferase involved in cell wall biosynthesis
LATIVCSRVENPNRVPVEAMAVGCPVVAADVPISVDVCAGAAEYYPAGDATALADVLRTFLDGARRSEFAQRGRTRLAGTDWLSATRTMLSAMNLS